jgi:3-oxoadipate enol-lactonase
MAEGLGDVTEMMIRGIFPWCFTPRLYTERPDYVESLAEFLRGRPMPSVDAFMRQSEAVSNHDATAQLGAIEAPTLVTYGRYDQVTSVRFADELVEGIPDTDLYVFEDCAHAPIYENVEAFNARTLTFLQAQSG